VVSVKEVFLLLPCFLLIEVLHWGINVMDMYFLFNLIIIKKLIKKLYIMNFKNCQKS
jgi:hypothetical protein